MADTRLKKITRDLTSDWQRSIIVVIAIAIGIFAFGSVIIAYSILDREINVNYLGTNPPSAILWVDHADQTLVEKAIKTGLVNDAELRRTIAARVQIGPDQWRPLTLFVIDDYHAIRIGKIRPQSGTWPPQRGEILIERAVVPLIPASTGVFITVKVPDKNAIELKVSGVVHDPAKAPANMENTVYGYITRDTLTDLGEDGYLDELMVITSGSAGEQNAIRKAAYQLKSRLEEEGIHVSRVDVPVPGKHPHANQLAALIFLFEAFGILSFILGIMLASMMINGLLAQQVRQIGIMRSLGATPGKVAVLYLSTVFILAFAATLLAIPAAVMAGTGLAGLVSGILNFNLTSTAIPNWVFILIITTGLAAPLLASLIPVLRGCRITIRESINDYGVPDAGGKERGRNLPLPRSVLMAFRNIFRKKGRAIQVIMTLATGGALFIVAMNLAASMDTTVDNALDTRQMSDIVQFSEYHHDQEITGIFAGIGSVAYVEPLMITNTTFVADDSIESNRFALLGIRPDTSMVTYPILQGRWLDTADANAIVLNHVLVDDLISRGLARDIHTGDAITLTINGNQTNWLIVGIAREMMAPARAYTNIGYLERLTGREEKSNAIAVRAVEQTPPSHTPALATLQIHGKEIVIPSPHGNPGITPDLITSDIERGMVNAGINVTAITSLGEMRIMMKEHLAVIAALITFLAVLVIVVGILSLVSAMNISMVERRREIGILRAIGATPRAITTVIATEALIIGLASWILAIVAAPLLSVIVGNIFGTIFFKSPLDIAFSHHGMFLWLWIIIILSPLASLLSAKNAFRQPIQEVLEYE